MHSMIALTTPTHGLSWVMFHDICCDRNCHGFVLGDIGAVGSPHSMYDLEISNNCECTCPQGGRLHDPQDAVPCKHLVAALLGPFGVPYSKGQPILCNANALFPSEVKFLLGKVDLDIKIEKAVAGDVYAVEALLDHR